MPRSHQEEAIREVLEEIRLVEKFTCDYWWPRLKELQSNPEMLLQTPTQEKVIEGIIKNRSGYVAKLREEVEFLRRKAIENNKMNCLLTP